ncbi:hypothetical protein H113_07885, partial [Trichophyton rubrum MR1459]
MTIIVEIYVRAGVHPHVDVIIMYVLMLPLFACHLGLLEHNTDQGKRRHIFVASLHYPVHLHASASSSSPRQKRENNNRRERTYDTTSSLVLSHRVLSCAPLSSLLPAYGVVKLVLGLLAKSVANSPAQKDRD